MITPRRVVIIGAGAAGLAAAAQLRAAGQAITLIEASPRIGGRACTLHPEALGGAAFDSGASWIHDADRNPLVAIAEAAGIRLIDPPEMAQSRSFVDTRLASPEDEAAYAAEQSAWEAALAARLLGPDVTVAEASRPRRGQPWAATVETWEAPIIAAADAASLSLRDWHANRLGGRNLRPPGGLGRFVAEHLGPAAGTVRLGVSATRLMWHGAEDGPGRGPGVAVETSAGTLAADAVIVTVSTGVLRAGTLRFDPPLPDTHQDAIEALPPGLLSKIALRATGADRLGLPSNCTLDRRLAPGEPAMVFQAWPDGADHLIGFVGGQTAWQLAKAGPRAAAAFARDQLAATLGGRARAAVAEAGVVSTWSEDPCYRGAYAYAVPGGVSARRTLAEPLAGGRLVFAGEATRSDGLAGTVGGAVLSGRHAADLVLAGFPARPERV